MDTLPQKDTVQRLLRPVVFLFFAAYLALGLVLVDDFGLTWDEEYERLHGLVVFDYFNDLSGGRLFDQPLSEHKLEYYFNRHYGTAFQTMAMGLEKLLGLDDPREWYLLRHYMTFIVWFIALVFFYKLLLTRFRNQAFSLLGVVFMILSPRIFADAFYNSKDVIFLAFYIIGSYTLVKFLRKPALPSAFWLALSSALLINTRILGFILPVVAVVFVVIKVYALSKKGETIRPILLHGSYSLMFLLFLTILLWPYLWESPVARMVESFRTMGHFPWDDPVLYWGKFIPGTKVPWHYIPSWILITVPVLYSVFFIVGAGFSLPSLFRLRLDEDSMVDWVSLALFFVPLLAVIMLGSTLYDGWRQMFFLYGPFMMLVMRGFSEMLKRCKGYNPARVSRLARFALFLAVSWTLGSTAFFMIKYHPHQNVYFNFIAGKETTKNFEADYWGMSYRQALEYLLEHDQRDSIPVVAANFPGRFNALIFPSEKRKRLHFVEYDQADYFLSNYRFPVEHEKYFKKEPPYDQVVWERRVRGNPIVGVYRLK